MFLAVDQVKEEWVRNVEEWKRVQERTIQARFYPQVPHPKLGRMRRAVENVSVSVSVEATRRDEVARGSAVSSRLYTLCFNSCSSNLSAFNS